MSGNELEGFVSEFPQQLLVAVPAYSPKSISDDAAFDDGIDNAMVPFAPPRPKSRPFRRLAFALWRATCAVAYAPVALVVFVATRIWWSGSWMVRGIWRGITAVVGFVTSVARACAHATVRAVAATARLLVATARAIAYAPVALVLFVVALVRSIVGACVRAVVRAVVATGALCVSVANAVATGVRRILTACAMAILGVARGIRHVVTGVLAFVTSTVNACVRAAVRAVVGTGAFCVFVAQAVAGGVKAVVALFARTIWSVVHATRRSVIAVRMFVRSIARAGFHALVRTLVMTGTWGFLAAQNAAAGVRAIAAGCVFAAHAVAAGVLAFVTAIVGACVYAVVWVAVVARTLCVLGAKALRASVHATRSRVRLIGAGISLAIGHCASSVRASAVAAGRAGEAGAERAILASGRSYARSTTAIVSGVSALRSGTQVAATTTARRAQTAGQTCLTAVCDAFRGLTARVAAFRVTVRVGAGATVPAEGAWSRRAVVAPAIGAVLLAAAATASTVLVISRLPGAPGRQAAVSTAAAIAPLSTPAASAAPIVSRPPEGPAVARPAIARVKVSDEAPANVGTRAIDANKMRALWLKADTRSLDRALSTVRQTTLAFKSCSVQVTETDQAVARCELASTGGAASRKTEWTIEFSRADAQWRIDGITEAGSGRPRR